MSGQDRPRARLHVARLHGNAGRRRLPRPRRRGEQGVPDQLRGQLPDCRPSEGQLLFAGLRRLERERRLRQLGVDGLSLPARRLDAGLSQSDGRRIRRHDRGGDLAVIYLEDADTDGDGLPDAWEYAQYGSLAARGAEQLSETAAGEFVINKDWAAAIKLQTGAKAPSAGLAGRIGSTLRNAGVLALSMGAPMAGYDSFAAAISGFVSPELVEDGVRITGLDMTDGMVSIKVEAETASADTAWIEGRKTLEVLCQVKWKSSLSDSVWTNLGEPLLITVGAGAAEIDISDLVPEGNSGFYSVDVYKK